MFPKGTRWIIPYYRGKILRWNEEKHALLKRNRGVSFEEIVIRIQNGGVLNRIDHPNRERYRNQKMTLVEMRRYILFLTWKVNMNHSLKPSFQAEKKPGDIEEVPYELRSL